VGGGIKVHSTLRPLNGLLCRWNDWQGKPKYSEKTCPSATLSTTNPTCCPYAKPGRRGGKPASNRWATARPKYLITLNYKRSLSTRSRDSVVGIAISYGLDDRGFGVRVPVGLKIFSSPESPDRLWGPPSLLSKGYLRLFPRGIAAGAWSWPLTSNYCLGQENVDLYIHSLTRLHGLVLN
jgi:hypothetical protein